MANEYTNVVSEVIIEEVGGSSYSAQTEILNVTVPDITKNVSYIRTRGGAIIPRVKATNSVTGSFQMLVTTTNVDIVRALENISEYQNGTVKTFNITFKWTSGSEDYGKTYGNCYIVSTTMSDTQIPTMTISFSVPVIDITTGNLNIIEVFDPTFVSALVSDANTIEILFNQSMTDPTGKHTEFDVVVESSAVTSTAVSLVSGNNYKMSLTIGTAISSGDEVEISYPSGTITSSSGLNLVAFTNETVTNGL